MAAQAIDLKEDEEGEKERGKEKERRVYNPVSCNSSTKGGRRR